MLSGGELQRVFLAEALVESGPELLLLDELLSNLDLRRERELVQLVDGVVRSRKVTALLIAHNINPLLPVLDKVIYIANGKIMIGRPEEVLTSDSLTELYGTPIEVCGIPAVTLRYRHRRRTAPLQTSLWGLIICRSATISYTTS